MSFEEAAAVCDGGIIALTCLRKAGLRQGQSIVVYGASGSIGTAGVQLAKAFGADVTAVCNTKNVELVRSLGADEVVDYTAVGLHEERRDLRRRLRRGRQALVQALPALSEAGRRLHRDRSRLSLARPAARAADPVDRGQAGDDSDPEVRQEEVVFLKELIEAGRYRPVIDRRYPLEDVVEATQYVETGQKTGNVVLTVADA